MRTIELTAYRYEELDDRGQAAARDWYRSVDTEGYDGSDDVDSLKAWADWFDLKIRDYSLGGSDNRSQGVKFELSTDSDVEAMRGVRLWKWFHNRFEMPDLSGGCPFTGYCMDETLLDGIRRFMARPWDCDYRELLQDCIDDFCQAYADECDYRASDEAVMESIVANEYEFTSAGKRFPF